MQQGFHSKTCVFIFSYSTSSIVLSQVYINESLGEIGFSSFAEHSEMTGADGSNGTNSEHGADDAGERGGGEAEAEARIEPYGCDPRSGWSPWR